MNSGYHKLFPAADCTMCLRLRESVVYLSEFWDVRQSPAVSGVHSFPAPAHAPDRGYTRPGLRYPAIPKRYPVQNSRGATVSATSRSSEYVQESSRGSEGKAPPGYPPANSW